MPKYSSYTILGTDTIQSIAYKTLKDTSRWIEIALLNDLEYPFITYTDDTTPGVKKVGDNILIPVDVPYNETSESVVSTDIGAELYGTDILLTTDKSNLSIGMGGEFSVDIYGDLQTVSGTECLSQDLMHRLLTELGTLPYHPQYGSSFLSIIGNKNDSTWRDKAVIELTKTFRSDPRVSDVKNTIITIVNDGLLIECTVVTNTQSVNISQVIGGDISGIQNKRI